MANHLEHASNAKSTSRYVWSREASKLSDPRRHQWKAEFTGIEHTTKGIPQIYADKPAQLLSVARL